MKVVERTGAPALGNAIGYFLVLWAVVNVPWITAENQVEAVTFAGTICIYVLNEARAIFNWIGQYLKRPKQ